MGVLAGGSGHAAVAGVQVGDGLQAAMGVVFILICRAGRVCIVVRDWVYVGGVQRGGDWVQAGVVCVGKVQGAGDHGGLI